MTLTDSEQRVLRILARGRSNTHHVYQQGQLSERAAKRVLTELCTRQLAHEVDRDLYQITSNGRDALERDYPDEAGFLQDTEVIHDAPMIKTIRLHGDRSIIEVQVDAESAPLLADALAEALPDHVDAATRLTPTESRSDGDL